MANKPTRSMKHSIKNVLMVTLRTLLLFILVTMVSWRVASPEIRSNYLSWVPKLADLAFGIDLRDQLAADPRSTNDPISDRSHLGDSPASLTQPQEPGAHHSTSHQASNHFLIDQTVCEQMKGGEVTTTSRQVYRWTDANGQTHIGDKPPPTGSNADNMTTKTLTTKRYFNLYINQENAKLPPFAVDRFNSELQQIYELLRLELNINEVRRVDLTLTLFDQRDAYLAYQRFKAPNLSNQSAGFFNPLNGEAAIYTADYAPQTFAITRHEATHAILSALYGQIPVWFNEGMAQYFESMSLQGQSKIMPVLQDHIEILRTALNTSDLPPLTTFFTLPPQQWYAGHGLSMRYQISWSLLFFLLSDPERSQFTRHMMNRWGEQFCAPFDAVRYFDTHYPRGLQQFEQEWHAWLQEEEHAPHRY